MPGTPEKTRARCARKRLAAAGLAAMAMLAGLAPAGAAERQPSGPAMWAISDHDTTIFLFGTFHALDPDTGWFSDVVRAAFQHSDQLVLETLVPSDPAVLLQSLSRHSLASPPRAGQPVIDRNSSSAPARSSSIAMEEGRASGLSVDNGADAVLRRAAISSGKAVGGLESFDFQLAMFSALPGVKASKPSSPPPASSVEEMKAAWKRGDQALFAAVLGHLETQAPETYRRMFAERNARWAQWVARRMEQPGVVFVAVGTGHLTGRDSLQRRLTEQGYQAVRIG